MWALECEMPIADTIVIRIQSNNTINQYSTNAELIQQKVQMYRALAKTVKNVYINVSQVKVIYLHTYDKSLFFEIYITVNMYEIFANL